MSKKLEWNLLHGSVLAIATIALITIGLITVGSNTVTASPQPHLNIKVKTCKVDTSPVSCKPLLKSINGDTFDLQVQRVGGQVVITLFPTESIRTP
jgi:hypothetical protein